MSNSRIFKFHWLLMMLITCSSTQVVMSQEDTISSDIDTLQVEVLNQQDTLFEESVNVQEFKQAEDSILNDTSGIESIPANDGTSDIIEYDTTEISLRKKRVIIVKDDDETRITIGRYEEDDDRDDSRRYSGKRHNKRYRDTDTDFLAFDLGVTNFHQDGTFGREATIDDLELRAFRPLGHWALHFFPTRTPLSRRGTVNLQTAITLDFNNYYFVRDITLLQDQETVTITETGDEFERNKLSALFAQVPLMINFRTRPRRSSGVSLSMGAYFGLLWRSRTVQKLDGDKIKVKDRFNLNNERFGLTARLSFKWFRLYFNYNLSDLFENGEGPEVSTFTSGINIIQF